MALGGGSFTSQNKILPGAYINFVSARRDYEISQRGVAALAISANWGPENEIISLEADTFQRKCMTIFGYDAGEEPMKGLRDLFQHAQKALLYRLSNNAKKASCAFADAKYSGTRGNDLKIIVKKNINDQSKYDVKTLLGFKQVDLQTVTSAADLIDNDYVVFVKDATLEETANTPLTGGTNGQEITGMEYQAFLDSIESYSFHTLGCLSTSEEVKSLFVEFTRRMRERVGAKFQTVLYKKHDADYEGIISVENKTLDDGFPVSSAVYWTIGAQAGCKINESCTNMRYNGEFQIEASQTQAQLEDAIHKGQFVFHRVGNEIHVLEDINTFISYMDDKSKDFSSNQTIRVADQIGNDIGSMFNKKYSGRIPNDAAGRMSLWNDIVSHHKRLAESRAIEEFEPSGITVEQGDTKGSVVVRDCFTIINAMSQLYMTVVIS